MALSQKVHIMAIRTKLAEIMKARDLSRMDIVRGANISYPTVARWENNELKRLDPETVKKLKVFLGVKDDDLYEVTED